MVATCGHQPASSPTAVKPRMSRVRPDVFGLDHAGSAARSGAPTPSRRSRAARTPMATGSATREGGALRARVRLAGQPRPAGLDAPLPPRWSPRPPRRAGRLHRRPEPSPECRNTRAHPARDTDSCTLTLTIGLRQSSDPIQFTPLPLTASQTSINAGGKLKSQRRDRPLARRVTGNPIPAAYGNVP